MPNVKFFFNHKLTGADFKAHKAWFEVSTGSSLKYSIETRAQEVEVEFDFMIGADGAHSAARYHMMKYVRMDYQQLYIDTLWCEFTIPAVETEDDNDRESTFRISPHHLHIWPGKEHMFIAIPSYVRSSRQTSEIFLTGCRTVHSPAHCSSHLHTSPLLRQTPPPSPPFSTPTSPA